MLPKLSSVLTRGIALAVCASVLISSPGLLTYQAAAQFLDSVRVDADMGTGSFGPGNQAARAFTAGPLDSSAVQTTRTHTAKFTTSPTPSWTTASKSPSFSNTSSRYPLAVIFTPTGGWDHAEGRGTQRENSHAQWNSDSRALSTLDSARPASASRIRARWFSPLPYFEALKRMFEFPAAERDLHPEGVMETALRRPAANGGAEGGVFERNIRSGSHLMSKLPEKSIEKFSLGYAGQEMAPSPGVPPGPPSAGSNASSAKGNGGSGGRRGIGKMGWLFIVGELILQVGVEVFLATFPMLLQKQFHDVTKFVWLGVGSAVGGVLGRGMSGVFKNRFGLEKTLWGALGLRSAPLLAITAIMIYMPGHWWALPLVIALYSVHGFIFGVSLTAETSIGPKLVDKSILDRFMAWRQILLQGVGTVGPLMSILMVARTGFAVVPWVFPLVLLISCLYFWRMFKNLKLDDHIPKIDAHTAKLVKTGFTVGEASKIVSTARDHSERIAEILRQEDVDSKIKTLLQDSHMLGVLLGVKPASWFGWHQELEGIDKDRLELIARRVNPEVRVLWDRSLGFERVVFYNPSAVVASMEESTRSKLKEVSFADELRKLKESGQTLGAAVPRVLLELMKPGHGNNGKIEVIFGTPPRDAAQYIRANRPARKANFIAQRWGSWRTRRYRNGLDYVQIGFGDSSDSRISWGVKDILRPESVRYASRYGTAFKIARETFGEDGVEKDRNADDEPQKEQTYMTPLTFMDKPIVHHIGVPARVLEHPVERQEETKDSQSEKFAVQSKNIFKQIGAKMREGASFVWKSPLLRTALIAYTAYLMMVPLLSFVAQVFSVRLLGTPEAATGVLGWIGSLFSAGALVGGLLMLRQQRSIDKAREAEAIDQAKSDEISSRWLLQWMKWGAVAVGLVLIFAFPGLAWFHLPKAFQWAHVTLQALLMIPFGMALNNAIIKITTLFFSKVPEDKRVEVIGFQGAVSLAVIYGIQIGFRYFFKLPGFTPFHYLPFFLIPVGILCYFLMSRMKRHLLPTAPPSKPVLSK